MAHAFNESLHNVLAEDPYSRSRHEAGRAEYARMLEIHERIGHVEIPKIEVDIPVYAGTSEEVLQRDWAFRGDFPTCWRSGYP
ncbi:TPA: hypothetical protein ACHU8K_000003 [Streptococcus suis]